MMELIWQKLKNVKNNLAMFWNLVFVTSVGGKHSRIARYVLRKRREHGPVLTVVSDLLQQLTCTNKRKRQNIGMIWNQFIFDTSLWSWICYKQWVASYQASSGIYINFCREVSKLVYIVVSIVIDWLLSFIIPVCYFVFLDISVVKSGINWPRTMTEL